MSIKFSDGLLGTEQVTFEMIVCCSCQVPFMVTSKHRERLVEKGERFSCPNGHWQSYSPSACKKREEELNNKLKQKEKQLNEAYEYNGQLRSERWDLQQQIRESKKQQCPHCPKQLINLERHIIKYHNG